MKKMKSLFRKLLILLLLPFFYIILTGPAELSINATGNKEIKKSQLLSENFRLKRKIDSLNNKMYKIENRLEKINEYNNEIYAQMLGVDFDTTNYYKYRNDSAKSVLYEHDSIFGSLNERMIYAAEKLALELKKVQKTSKLFKHNKNAIYYYPNITPVKTGDFITLSSPFGWRKHPISGEYLFHEGVDISARSGTDVHATAQGTIKKVMRSEYGYGNRVVIEHSYGFQTLYAHLGIIKVKEGQWVRKNQIIATVGNTGRSTGSHLHYEIHKYSELRDPLGYFYTHITNEYLAMK